MTTRKDLPKQAAIDAEVRAPSPGSTAPKVSLSALIEQAAGLRRAQTMAGLAHVITAPDGSFESWSETLPDLIGIPPGEVAPSTRKWLELIHSADRETFRQTALWARAERKRAYVEYRLRRKNGTWIHVRQVMEPIPGQTDEQGRMRWFNTLQDVSDQKNAEERIRRLNRVYAVLSGINSLIVRVRGRDELFKDACELTVEQGGFRMAWIGIVDPGAQRITRMAAAGDVRDFFRAERFSLREGTPDFGLSGKAIKELKPALSQDIQRDPNSLRKKDYAERGINSLCVLPLIVGGKGVGVLALYASEVGFFDDGEMRLLLELAGDVSFAIEHIEKSEQAAHLAYYDTLTGLANRQMFHERLAQHVQTARGAGRNVALAILDIERFKSINDTMGRQAGDALLADLAQRFSEVVPPTELARIGSDLFALVLPDASDEALARRVEEHLKAFFGAPYRLGDVELMVSAKLGIALFPDDAQDAEALFAKAEAALKKAKAAGERYLFYEERMTERVAEKLALENKLRRALENGEFLLHYQPKVEVDKRAPVGVEALLRWKSPELGLVPPLSFVSLLEETGLILDVGSWAIRQASLDHRRMVEEGFKAARVAVNVSAIQLRQSNFVRLVEDAIVEGLAPTGIDLELTESLMMDDIQANIEKLASLRRLAINVSIDDFGTGYSSLAYLAKLPVQALKIDRSFINTMQDDPNALTLVSTIISLAHSLKLKVIAEGVETEAQAKILRLLRCDEMQGYLISKPLPFDELMAFMRRQS